MGLNRTVKKQTNSNIRNGIRNGSRKDKKKTILKKRLLKKTVKRRDVMGKRRSIKKGGADGEDGENPSTATPPPFKNFRLNTDGTLSRNTNLPTINSVFRGVGHKKDEAYNNTANKEKIVLFLNYIKKEKGNDFYNKLLIVFYILPGEARYKVYLFFYKFIALDSSQSIKPKIERKDYAKIMINILSVLIGDLYKNRKHISVQYKLKQNRYILESLLSLPNFKNDEDYSLTTCVSIFKSNPDIDSIAIIFSLLQLIKQLKVTELLFNSNIESVKINELFIELIRQLKTTRLMSNSNTDNDFNKLFIQLMNIKIEEEQMEIEKLEIPEKLKKLEKLQETTIIDFILQQFNHIDKKNKDLILENFNKINFAKINIVLDLLKDQSLSDNLFELISHIQSKIDSADNQDDVVLGFFELLIRLSDEKMEKLLDILLTKFRDDKQNTDIDGQILCISLLQTFYYQHRQQQQKLITPSYIPNILENFVKSLIIIDELGFIYRLFQLLKLLNDNETNTYFKILNNSGDVEQCKIIIKLIGILVGDMRVENITKLIQILGNPIFMEKMIFNQKIALLWLIINKTGNNKFSLLNSLHSYIQQNKEDDFIKKLILEIQITKNPNDNLIILSNEQTILKKYQELVDRYNFELIVETTIKKYETPEKFEGFEEVFNGFEEINKKTPKDIEYDTSKYYTNFIIPSLDPSQLKIQREAQAASRKAMRKAALEAEKAEKAAREAEKAERVQKAAAAASSKGRKKGQAADSSRGRSTAAASSRGHSKAAASSRGRITYDVRQGPHADTSHVVDASSRGQADEAAAFFARRSGKATKGPSLSGKRPFLNQNPDEAKPPQAKPAAPKGKSKGPSKPSQVFKFGDSPVPGLEQEGVKRRNPMFGNQ